MRYAVISTKIYSKTARKELFPVALATQMGILLLLLLAVLYVAETNSAIFSERSIPEKKDKVVEAEQDVTLLQIQAARMRSAEQVGEMAASSQMKFSENASYVSMNDGTVVLAR